jgi:hypothetical protein
MVAAMGASLISVISAAEGINSAGPRRSLKGKFTVAGNMRKGLKYPAELPSF